MHGSRTSYLGRSVSLSIPAIVFIISTYADQLGSTKRDK